MAKKKITHNIFWWESGGKNGVRFYVSLRAVNNPSNHVEGDSYASASGQYKRRKKLMKAYPNAIEVHDKPKYRK